MKQNITDKSWVVINTLKPLSKTEFDELYSLHPKDREKGTIFGREYTVPRWQQLYMTPYKFNGMQKEPEENIPKVLERIFAYAKETYNKDFNQMLINWYENGSDYISLHADDEPEIKKNSEIFSLTLAEEGTERIFRIRDKKKKKLMDVTLKNGLYLVMGGNFQSELRHEVTKTAKEVGKRINITFRVIEV